MRLEFSAKTKLEAWNRCEGNCELCGLPIKPLRPEYHHRVEASLGGKNDLDNVWVLHPACHRSITTTHSIPFIAKADRIARKSKGITRSKTRWAKRPMNGFRREADGDMDT